MLGGQALKQVLTRRYSKEEYIALLNEVNILFSKDWDNVIWSPTTSYRKKETFGDLDLLVCNNGITMDIVREKVDKIFSPHETYRNGNCISFDYKEFQIDIILVDSSEWHTSLVYFSYNDLGNFMGRTARDLGFRYGAYGLAYDFDKGGRIIVSTDSEKIFTFLGYDYERYLKGFDTLEEIFEYVVNSKYFNRRSFAYENLNHVNRSRNLKRKSYVSFMEYIQNISKPDSVLETKQKYLDYAILYFDGSLVDEAFVLQLADYHDNLKIKEESKNLFNGKIIEEYFPTIEKKNYSLLINNYKDSVRNFLNKEDELSFELYTLEIGETDILMKEFALVNKLKLNQ